MHCRKRVVTAMLAAGLVLGVAPWSPLSAADGTAAGRQAGPTDVERVLARATAYVTGYLRHLASVVCEERYEQKVQIDGATGDGKGGMRATRQLQTRSLVSDVLLVQIPDTIGWVAFRDVYSVDGQPVRDREDRLLKLFVEPHRDRLQQAERIRDEASRYNLGSGFRDINVPTFALQFLLDEVRDRFAFRLLKSERVDEVDAAVIAYEETRRPTIVKGDLGRDMPARGQFWIDPSQGRVLRTRLETRAGGGRVLVEVAFEAEARLGILVPAEMIERRQAGGETETGRASYSNFRQFRVETSERVR